MMNLSVHKPFDLGDLAAAAMPYVRRLLPEPAEVDDPIHVDVRVRSYSDSLPTVRPLPAARPRTGTLPVGTLLDCYL